MELIPVIVAAVIAFVVSSVLGIKMIPFLRKIKYGQTILDIGPKWHKNKEGTPTMGGFMIIAGVLLGSLVGFSLIQLNLNRDVFAYTMADRQSIFLGLIMAVLFGLIGFADDYIKVVKKQNEGLTSWQKFAAQTLVAIAYLISRSLMGDYGDSIWIPFFGNITLGWLYYPLAVLGIVFFVNAVNLSDGVDGLCSSLSVVSGLSLAAVALLPNIGYPSVAMMAAALAGGCGGFLIWNKHPAKVFMGDTGSLFLGGMIVAIAFAMHMPILILLIGLVFIIDALSVVVQTTYFKYTKRKYGEGRRIFKMSPIHHHFEMSGWSEVKIVSVACGIQIIFCLLGILAAAIR